METENINKSSTLRVVVLIITIPVLLFLTYYTVMSFLSPGRKMAEIKEVYATKKDDKALTDERVFTDSTYLRLFHNKSFLESRIAMAESDSIYLTLNISDSTANLEISGVAVNRSKMSYIEVSKILREGNDHAVLSMLAKPFTISSSVATIMKDPVMVKVAPKDTSEYVADIMPDTSLTEPVSYIFEMTNGTRVYICQEENDKASEEKAIAVFDRKYRMQDAWVNLKSILKFKVPEYHPFIKIRLPRADAKIIYRALPKNGQIGIYK